MTYASQNNEAEIVAKYFNGFIGVLLDIGANDGKTFSNSYDLIKSGWVGELIEPTERGFNNLSMLYCDNPKIALHNFVVGSKYGIFDFCSPNDSLLATNDPSLLDKWKNKGVTYEVVKKLFCTFADAKKIFMYKTFDFITIDAEGMDLEILLQMDLNALGCKCICVEHNSDKEVYNKIKSHCSKFGLTKELLYNAENTILAR